MKKKKIFSYGLLVGFSLLSAAGHAQLLFSAQFRPRFEYRNGYGTLRPLNYRPALFTSQRTRLSFHYQLPRVTFHVSLQDVRVWGQDASTITNNDGSRLGVHEAWAELVLANKKDSSFRSPVDYFGIRAGRQELVYDDSRLLGNMDWIQQGRRHDALVLKFRNHGYLLDLGMAFNQNTDGFNYNGTYYTPANVPAYVKDSRGNLAPTPAGYIPLTNAAGWSAKTGSPSLVNPPSTNGLNQEYKSLQFLYASKSIGNIKISALVLADEFGKYILDSVKNISGADTGYIYGRHFNQAGVNIRFTQGLLVNAPLTSNKKMALTAGGYYQAGHDRDGQLLNAYTLTGALSYATRPLTYTIGWDYLSGNDAFSASTVNHRFDPLYGTPHKFWGYMDYFYAGTGSPAGGLSNPYAKVKFTSAAKKIELELDYNMFCLASNQKDTKGAPVPKYLGGETDLMMNYTMNKWSSLLFGFSLMKASHSMEYAKAVTPGTSRLNNTWSFLQLDIRPEYLFK